MNLDLVHGRWKILSIVLSLVVIFLLAYISHTRRDIPSGTIVDQYSIARFKVIAMTHNPFGNQGALYVVAERGINDSGCGGAYGPHTCYFFLESNYYGVPPTRYIGPWSGGFVAIGNEFRFTDENTVIFDAEGGDAGIQVSEVWKLDIKTGSTTMLSRKVTGNN